jgi:microcystin degradation protein MlrC
MLCLHGTMVAEGYPHADAEVVRRVRDALGNSIPIVVTHDFHANVSPEIVRLSTALNTVKECPHLDTKERGIREWESKTGAGDRQAAHGLQPDLPGYVPPALQTIYR